MNIRRRFYKDGEEGYSGLPGAREIRSVRRFPRVTGQTRELGWAKVQP